MSEEKPTENELIQEGIAATTQQAIKIGKQAQEIRRLQVRISELEEKLNNEWKPASEAVEGEVYDLWAVDYCHYQGCTLGRYRICNCRWDGEDNLWRHLSGAPVDSHEERTITHARLIPSPPTPLEGGKE